MGPDMRMGLEPSAALPAASPRGDNGARCGAVAAWAPSLRTAPDGRGCRAHAPDNPGTRRPPPGFGPRYSSETPALRPAPAGNQPLPPSPDTGDVTFIY